uniref:Uncharacterized protein n=1 Tax=Pfiesteria piscicida TaxID=71001 RepID=E8Z6M7_PFIPI|nr:unknown [Pfiesteria piscicida]
MSSGNSFWITALSILGFPETVMPRGCGETLYAVEILLAYAYWLLMVTLR